MKTDLWGQHSFLILSKNAELHRFRSTHVLTHSSELFACTDDVISASVATRLKNATSDSQWVGGWHLGREKRKVVVVMQLVLIAFPHWGSQPVTQSS